MKTYGGFLISRARQLQARAFQKMLRQSGIDAFNGAQGRILYVLWEHGELTISKISELTSLAGTTLTSMLDRMERANLIVRTPDASNRRQVIVRITEQAEAFRAAYDRVSDDMNALFYKGFTEEEIRLFETMLQRTINNLTNT